MKIKAADMGNLGPEEMKILQNLANPTMLSDDAKQEAAEYLSKVIGNTEYNKRVSKALKERNDLEEENESTLEDLRSLSYRSRNLTELRDILDRAKTGWGKSTKIPPENLEQHERLTLQELGQLRDAEKIWWELEQYSQSGILVHNNEINKVYSFAKETHEFIIELDSTLQKDLNLRSGDLVMFEFSKEGLLKRKQLSTEGVLTKTFVSEYSHAAQLFRDKKDENKLGVSHVWGEYQSEVLSASTIAHSSIFRLHVGALLSPDSITKLKAKYGDKYEEKVQEMHEDICNKLQMSVRKRFRSTFNDKSKRIWAGLADFIPRGHKGSSKNHKFKSFFEKEYKKDKMICSEFVAKSLLSSVDELNKTLQKELGTTEQVVKMPFDKKEILSRIHPERLVSLLRAQGALEDVPLPPVLAQFITTEEPKSQKHFHAAQTALKKKDPIALLLEDKNLVQKKLRELETSGTVTKDKIDPIIKYMDKIAQEKRWPILSAVTNRLKKIFRISTSKEQLRKLITEASEQVKAVTQASIAGVHTFRLAELRKQYLNPTPKIGKAK